MVYSNKTELYIQSVLSNDLVSNTTAILKYKKNEDFKAGQVVKITTNKDIPPRIYSICSAEKDEEISILYKIIPSGKLTPILNNLTSGDQFYVSSPYGSFTANNDPAWFIATGTGIAPFISMIFSGYDKNKTLIHGSRDIQNLYFYKDMRRMLGSNYYPCCATAKDDDIYRGRVTKFISERTDLSQNNKYYLCGKAEMVVEIRDFLINRGIPFQNILSEIYF